MADERRRRQRRIAVVANLAFALVVADAGAATTSLVAGEPWDWGRFWWFFFLVLLSAGASSVASAMARRTMPKAQGKSAEDDEVTRAMRTGLLPPDAEPQSWRRRIRRQGGDTLVVTSGKPVALGGEVLGVGGHPGVADQQRRPGAPPQAGRCRRSGAPVRRVTGDGRGRYPRTVITTDGPGVPSRR